MMLMMSEVVTVQAHAWPELACYLVQQGVAGGLQQQGVAGQSCGCSGSMAPCKLGLCMPAHQESRAALPPRG